MAQTKAKITTKGTGDFAPGTSFTKLSLMGDDVVDSNKPYKIVGIATSKADNRAWGFQTDEKLTIPFATFYGSKVEGQHNTNVAQSLTGKSTKDEIQSALEKGLSLDALSFSFVKSEIKFVNNSQRYDISSYPMFDTFPKDEYGNPSVRLKLEQDGFKTDDQRRDLFRALYAGEPKRTDGHPIVAYDYTLALHGEAPALTAKQKKEALEEAK